MLTIASDKSYAEVLENVMQEYPNAEITPLSIYKKAGAKEKNISFHLEFYKND